MQTGTLLPSNLILIGTEVYQSHTNMRCNCEDKCYEKKKKAPETTKKEKRRWSHSVVSNSLGPQGLCNPPGFSIHGISRLEYWSGLPFPSPGDVPDPRIEPRSPSLPAEALPSEPTGNLPRLLKPIIKLTDAWGRPPKGSDNRAEAAEQVWINLESGLRRGKGQRLVPHRTKRAAAHRPKPGETQERRQSIQGA